VKQLQSTVKQLLLLFLRDWVLKSGMLVAMSVYTYLRLIVDHGGPTLLILRQKEVDYCISMLREKVRRREGRMRMRGSLR